MRPLSFPPAAVVASANASSGWIDGSAVTVVLLLLPPHPVEARHCTGQYSAPPVSGLGDRRIGSPTAGMSRRGDASRAKASGIRHVRRGEPAHPVNQTKPRGVALARSLSQLPRGAGSDQTGSHPPTPPRSLLPRGPPRGALRHRLVYPRAPRHLTSGATDLWARLAVPRGGLGARGDGTGAALNSFGRCGDGMERRWRPGGG
jgi:hypothetical protein